MNKLNLSLGILLIGTAFTAGNFIACSSNSGGGGTPGTAGTSAAGTSGGGTNGAAGTSGGGSGGSCTAMGATKADCTCVAGAYKRMGVCACQDGMPDICPTVGCTDKKLDAANCGACGMACPATATCNNGACGAAPAMALAPVAGCTGLSIAADASGVYYADAAHNSISKVGGAAALAMNEMGATWLAINGTNLYWYNKGTKTVRKMPQAGGTPADVYKSATDDLGGFVVTADGMSVYISAGMAVIKVSATVAGGGTPVTIANEVHGGIPEFLALNGTSNVVFPTGLNGDVDAPLIAATASTCGMEDPANPGNAIMTTCARLARSQGELFPFFVAVIGGHAYWVDGPNVKGEMIGAMGTTFDSIAQADNGITAAVASTDTIYFASTDQQDAKNAVILKTPLAPNSTPIKLARAQNAPNSMALDATKVYWATADCGIFSIAK
jgi:hypothetical protein